MNIEIAGIIQESKKRQTAIAIHKYSLAHAGTAFLLAQTEFGDEVALSILTVAMITTIMSINGGKWHAKLAGSIISLAAGEVLGLRGSALLYKWIPGVGNIANALSSATTTEILGWTTYALVSSGLDPENLTEQQKKDIKDMAARLKTSEANTGRDLYKKMSRADKRAIDDLVKMLRKSKDEALAERLGMKIAQIIGKYV